MEVLVGHSAIHQIEHCLDLMHTSYQVSKHASKSKRAVSRCICKQHGPQQQLKQCMSNTLKLKDLHTVHRLLTLFWRMSLQLIGTIQSGTLLSRMTAKAIAINNTLKLEDLLRLPLY